MLLLCQFFSYGLIFALLLALAYNDLKDYILPNVLNLALAIVFMSFHTLTGWQIISLRDALLGAIVGGGFLYVIRAVANHFYKEDSIGLGDVKLMAAAGIGLGFPNILLATSLGAFLGFLHGILMGARQRKTARKKINIGEINVPAGLGLALGIAIVMVFQFGFFWRGAS